MFLKTVKGFQVSVYVCVHTHAQAHMCARTHKHITPPLRNVCLYVPSDIIKIQHAFIFFKYLCSNL